MSNEPVCEFLDIETVEGEINEIVPVDATTTEIIEHDDEDSDIKRKTKYVEENMISLIEDSKIFMQQVKLVAQSAETGAAFLAAAKMFETSAALNKDLLQIQHEKQNLGIEKPVEEEEVTNNIVHTTTLEMGQRLKEIAAQQEQEKEKST